MIEFHVMFLTKNEQACIRMMLFDLLSKHIKKSTENLGVNFFDYEDKINYDKTEYVIDCVSHAYQTIVNAVDMYEKITETLPTMNTVHKASDITWQIDKKTMKYVVAAINTYDIENSVLAKEEHAFISKNIKPIKKF